MQTYFPKRNGKLAFQGLLFVASICWWHLGKATDTENPYLGAQVDSGKLLNLIQICEKLGFIWKSLLHLKRPCVKLASALWGDITWHRQVHHSACAINQGVKLSSSCYREICTVPHSLESKCQKKKTKTNLVHWALQHSQFGRSAS